MLIKSIRLNNYRNYSNYYIELDPNINIVIGNNGIGKTNLLESIIVISNTKSFRTLIDKDLIKKNEEYLKIELNSDINKYKIVINKNNKSLYINNNLIKRTSDYLGKINAVLFKPSDLTLFSESPSIRRREIDIEISKINNNYLLNLTKYNSLLADKNKLLKELEIDEMLLSIINESMIKNIETIILEREKFFEEINKNLTYFYNKISNANNKLEIIYKKCSEIKDIKDNLLNSKEKDNYYHYATFGPHHDDYCFMLNNYELKSIASQGQERMAMIAYKFSLIKYIEKITKESPILLLDDILSELDKDNEERLLDILPSNNQIIITNTDINNLKINKKYKLIEIKEK